MPEIACPIWGIGTSKVIERATGAGDFREISSSRIGGWFRITGSVEPRFRRLYVEQQLSLSRWIAEQHRVGVECPSITTSNFDHVSSLPSLSFTDRVSAALDYFDRVVHRLDKHLYFHPQLPVLEDTGRLMSRAEIEDFRELASFFLLLERMDYVSLSPDASGGYSLNLSPIGWQRIEELSRQSTNSSQAFVAMWFDPKMGDAYEKGFAPAIIAAGYSPLRIDKKHHVNKVDDEIIAEIRRSRFVVSDFTCAPEKPRGGVYFEAGFAYGLGIPVIWTCAKSSLKDLHFDTRQFNHIVWESHDDLADQLKVRISAVIGDGPEKA